MNPPESPSPISLPDESVAYPLHRFSHQAMACTWGVLILGEDGSYAEQAARAAFDEIDRIEKELSRFQPDSDISRINALRANQSAQVGVEAFDCLELARRIHQETDGAFDVTIGALLPDEKNKTTGEAPAVGMNLLALDRPNRLVTALADGVTVDLGGLGKGYAIDRVVELLGDWSISAAMIHSGQSTVHAVGHPPNEPGWRVTIRDPLDHAASLRSIRICDRAVSGSGTLLHGPHIVDPHTQKAAADRPGAWALADSAALADALSTAFMILSPQQVADYCRAHAGVTALICQIGENGPQLEAFGPEPELA